MNARTLKRAALVVVTPLGLSALPVFLQIPYPHGPRLSFTEGCNGVILFDPMFDFVTVLAVVLGGQFLALLWTTA